MIATNPIRIPDEVLAEQYYRLVHHLIGEMQARYRTAGIPQKIMAAKLGKKPSFISRCLSGQTNMTIRTIHELVRAMDARLEIQVRALSDIAVKRNRQIRAQTPPTPNVSSGGTVGTFIKEGTIPGVTGTSPGFVRVMTDANAP
jgi:hypothetical protein